LYAERRNNKYKLHSIWVSTNTSDWTCTTSHKLTITPTGNRLPVCVWVSTFFLINTIVTYY
jgi:hypothetical protein